MQSAINSIFRQVTRTETTKLKILTAVTHESYEKNLALTNCEFYAIQAKDIKPWTESYRKLPSNYHILPLNYLPDYESFDLVLSQQKFGQFQILKPLADKLHLPLISLEHTLTMPFWDNKTRTQLRNMRGDINVFISDFSKRDWGWLDEGEVIHHGINTEDFRPLENRENIILSVVNDFVNRGPICGFPLWRSVIKDLPVRLVGANPGISEPAKNMEELATFYGKSKIFLNTSVISPIPMSLLEAMSAGCAVVSTANCMIPEIIQHGVNGFITNDEREMRGYLEDLLRDDKLAATLGQNARNTILEQFNLKSFVDNWDMVFRKASNIIFRG
jgi:glycosyltransferase involved in cell wall biosynthesis